MLDFAVQRALANAQLRRGILAATLVALEHPAYGFKLKILKRQVLCLLHRGVHVQGFFALLLG